MYNMIIRIPKKRQENWNHPVKDKFQHIINEKKTNLNKVEQNHISIAKGSVSLTTVHSFSKPSGTRGLLVMI